jgi:hypothetical protein
MNEDVSRALLMLAVATRETIDEGVIAVYQEDLAEFDPDIVVEACEGLRQSAVWFPKVAELVQACKIIRQAIRAKAEYPPALPAAPITEEARTRGQAIRDKFLADLRAMIRSKKFPGAEPVQEEPIWIPPAQEYEQETFRCLNCYDKKWIEHRCQGGDQRTCGRGAIGRYETNPETGKTHYWGSCTGPHVFMVKCACTFVPKPLVEDAPRPPRGKRRTSERPVPRQWES